MTLPYDKQILALQRAQSQFLPKFSDCVRSHMAGLPGDPPAALFVIQAFLVLESELSLLAARGRADHGVLTGAQRVVLANTCSRPLVDSDEAFLLECFELALLVVLRRRSA